MTKEIIGYTDKIISYEPIYKVGPDRVVTQAFILCKLCESAISPCGGPNHSAVCLECIKNLL